MAKNKGEAPAENAAAVESPAVHAITIAGIALNVPSPFGEGHVLTSVEAGVLNQTYSENIRNNFASAVKKATAEAEAAGTPVDPGALQTALDEYISTYTFGVRRGGGTRAPIDPVEKETKRIATEKVKAALKKKGMKFKDIDTDNFNALVTQVIEGYPQIREAAQQIVAARSEIGSDELDLDI